MITINHTTTPQTNPPPLPIHHVHAAIHGCIVTPAVDLVLHALDLPWPGFCVRIHHGCRALRQVSPFQVMSQYGYGCSTCAATNCSKIGRWGMLSAFSKTVLTNRCVPGRWCSKWHYVRSPSFDSCTVQSADCDAADQPYKLAGGLAWRWVDMPHFVHGSSLRSVKPRSVPAASNAWPATENHWVMPTSAPTADHAWRESSQATTPLTS